jgi:hypothetical protein
MTKVGFNTWWEKQCPTVFKVKNITKAKGGVGKTVRIFGVPIPVDTEYDLLSIPEVSEADIRHSLLKGTLMIKIATEEIRVVDSNIDLLQFDDCQKAFLQNAGITIGLEVNGGGGNVDYLWRQGIALTGIANGANRVFFLPAPDKALIGTFEDNEFDLEVFHNGRRLIRNIDYIASESGGIGTGFDTVEIIAFVPSKKSKLVANYTVENPA